MPTDTPMMQQYKRAKASHPDALVLFRMGDFYELFFDDARTAARLLGLTLTSRDKSSAAPVPMAGVPHHAVDGYIARLLSAGHRVAICEQMEDPRGANGGRGILERRVVEVISPGTVTSASLLPERENRYLAALVPHDATVGLALCDVSTGEMLLADCTPDELPRVLARHTIVETLHAEDAPPRVPHAIDATGASLVQDRASEGGARTARPSRDFDPRRGRERLLQHLGVVALDAFGCDDLVPALGAAGAILAYLAETHGAQARAVASVARVRSDDVLLLDDAALATLEVLESTVGGRSATLLGLLDTTRTAMGGRLLRRVLRAPLTGVARIEERQEAVAYLIAHAAARTRLCEALDGIGDLERLVARVVSERATPRELAVLRDSLARVALVRDALADALSAANGSGAPALLASAHADLPDPAGLVHTLGTALVDDPPPTLTGGGIFRRGHNAMLDEVHDGARDGKTWIASLQETERVRTGIGTLKVGYNRVFGYYIEVSRGQSSRVPEDYQRKQSLVGAERYITPELKDVEARVLGAEERAARLEQQLFLDLRARVAEEAPALRRTAGALAWVDVLAALAHAADARGWVRPAVDASDVIDLADARHPVVEAALPAGTFVPNDAHLDGGERRLALVTGPNMAGKSTYLRQVGLIVLLAQTGSWVPAARARIGVADRIFTRVGAADAIARGRSTFLVEMIETATILRNATTRSLVLLDEIGRGTSTYDGLAIAWSVCEDLARTAPRALFATHYHELTHLAGQLAGVRTLNVLVREWGDEIVFLHRIVEGAADRSYGIHVAQLAGLPAHVVDRAREILTHLEAGRSAETVPLTNAGAPAPEQARDQLALFVPARESARLDEVRRALDALDVNQLTPLDALTRLAELKRVFGTPS